MDKKEIHRKVLEYTKKYGMGKEIFEEGFVEGQKKTLGDLLLRECPVKYFNGTSGNAVPSEVIKKKLEELE